MPYEFTMTFKVTDRSMNDLVDRLYSEYLENVYEDLLEKGFGYDVIDNLPRWKELTSRVTEVRKTRKALKELLIPEIEKVIRKRKQDFNDYFLDYIIDEFTLYYENSKAFRSMVTGMVRELANSEDIKKLKKQQTQIDMDHKKKAMLKLAKELGAKVTFDS